MHFCLSLRRDPLLRVSRDCMSETAKETHMRRPRWEQSVILALGMVLGAATVLAMGATWAHPGQPAKPQVAEVVRAKRFELVDSSGRVRVRLSVTLTGGSSIDLLDNEGQIRANLGVRFDDSPSLDLRDREGKMRASMRILSDGSPGLNLLDKERKNRAALFLFSDGSPMLSLADKGESGDRLALMRASLAVKSDGYPELRLQGKGAEGVATLDVAPGDTPELRMTKGILHTTRALLNVSTDGPSGLWLTDKEGQPRAGIAVKSDGSPSLNLQDKEGKPRASLGVLADGSPGVVLCDKDGKKRAVLGRTVLESVKTGEETTTAESSLTLFDKEGKVLWKAPPY